MSNDIENHLHLRAPLDAAKAEVINIRDKIRASASRIQSDYQIADNDAFVWDMRFVTGNTPPEAIYLEIEAFMERHNAGGATLAGGTTLDAHATFTEESDWHNTRWLWCFGHDSVLEIETGLSNVNAIDPDLIDPPGAR